MSVEIAGIGNAIMDALVVAEHGDALLDELGLVRGTMHAVDHGQWQAVYDRVKHLGVSLHSGGSCANTIATLGRLGADVVYFGQVGRDELAEAYAERMIASCGKHALRVSDRGPTGKCLSIISKEDAERTMVTDLGVSPLFEDVGTFTEQLDTCRVAHFTGYTLLDGPARPVVLAAMERVRRAGGLVSLDVADPFVVTATKDLLWDTIDKLVDIVFLNADEARALTDVVPEQAAQVVAQQAKVRTVVVKLGARGSLVLDQGELYQVDAEMVDAIDTTGAGDAYAGGFLYGFVKGWTPGRAGALGSAIAAATVSQVGAVVEDNELVQAILARS